MSIFSFVLKIPQWCFSIGFNKIGTRGGSRTAATSKMERFLIIVNSFQRFVVIVNGSKLLTIDRKHSILNVAAVLDPPLGTIAEGLFYLTLMSSA